MCYGLRLWYLCLEMHMPVNAGLANEYLTRDVLAVPNYALKETSQWGRNSR
jgi:hypothetical protein